MDKREVYMLTGLHKANNVIQAKKNYKGERVIKPQAVLLYNRYMSGVDLTDQYLQYYSFLRKTVKWSKKFMIHCLNMIILNAYILHKNHCASPQKSHWHFRLELAKELLKNAKENPRGLPPDPSDMHSRLVERHFMEPLPPKDGTKRKHPSRDCFVCKSIKSEDLSETCVNESGKDFRRSTCYWCPTCKRNLCINPCFRIYHSEEDYSYARVKYLEENKN